jgi:hypothetical protein
VTLGGGKYTPIKEVLWEEDLKVRIAEEKTWRVMKGLGGAKPCAECRLLYSPLRLDEIMRVA